MPNISFTIPEVHSSVLRPVALSMVRQVCEITKISKDTPIYFPDATEAVAQSGSTLSDANGEKTRLTYDENIQIEVVENYNEGMILSTIVTKPENIPVFMDPDCLVLIRPAYSSTDVDISFKYSSTSRTTAERWRDDIRMRLSMSRDINLHELTYHYPIPQKFLQILFEIYTLREKTAPYGQTFAEYLENYASTRMTMVSNQSGGITQLAIAETQVRVQGLFDFEIAPEKGAKDGNSSNWITTFTYKFRYDKPIFCNMTYPVMIHNELLPETCIPTTPSIDYDYNKLSFTKSLGDLNKFERTQILANYYNYMEPIKNPSYDEFIPSSAPLSTKAVYTTLCSVDPEDKKDLLNLGELDDFQFDSDILDFIKAVEYRFMAKPFASILNVSVYRNVSLAKQNDITITSGLNVRTSWDMSLRVNHRVVIGLCTDLTLLSNEALRRLLEYPVAGRKLLAGINASQAMIDSVRNRVNLNGLYDNDNGSTGTWDALKDTIVNLNTVNTYYIVANKLDK